MDDEVRGLQRTLRALEEETTESLGDLHDHTLDKVTGDGRTLRQVIYGLTDHYRENIEQLLWAKRGRSMPRSESNQALAELQAARARFAANFADLRSEQLDNPGAPAQDASTRDVIFHAVTEERSALALIRETLGK
tara:strand:+ start:533 stop:940 length:408 start_codon:yes stop_codon:yes gene_type:complete